MPILIDERIENGIWKSSREVQYQCEIYDVIEAVLKAFENDNKYKLISYDKEINSIYVQYNTGADIDDINIWFDSMNMKLTNVKIIVSSVKHIVYKDNLHHFHISNIVDYTSSKLKNILAIKETNIYKVWERKK